MITLRDNYLDIRKSLIIHIASSSETLVHARSRFSLIMAPQDMFEKIMEDDVALLRACGGNKKLIC